MQKHRHLGVVELAAVMGFALAAAFLLRMLLTDWARLVVADRGATAEVSCYPSKTAS